jgi:TRAP-type mannitol/chloroaromatic compound transport system permease small subunit
MAELNGWLVRAKLAVAAVLLVLTGIIALVRGIARLP